MPGLINTHTHAPMVMYRGLADDLALMEWLQKYIFPAEAKTVSPEFVRIGTRLAVLEMIESGTTTYADMYYFEEEIAKATRDAGLRGVLGADHHPVSGGGREDAGRGAGPGGRLPQGIQGRQPDRAGRRAAFDVHARPGVAARVRGAGEEVRCADIDSSCRDRGRGEDREGAAQGDAGRLSGVHRLLGPPDARGPRCLGDRRGHSDSRSGGRWACHTTRKAT